MSKETSDAKRFFGYNASPEELRPCRTCGTEFMSHWSKDCPECRGKKKDKNYMDILEAQKKRTKKALTRKAVIVVKEGSEAWAFRGDIMCQECSKSLPTGSRGAYRGPYKDSSD